VDDGYINIKLVEGTINDKSLIENNHYNGLVVEHKFVNLTSEYIVICFRDGTRSILSPQSNGPYLDNLIIGHKKSNLSSPITIVEGEECERTNFIRSKLVQTKGMGFYFDESFNINTLRNSRSGVYASSADVIITLVDNIHRLPDHPFSRQRVHNLYLNLVDNFNPETDVSIGIRIIDNEGTPCRVYVIFQDTIMTLSSKKSNTEQTGVYVSGLSSLNTDSSNNLRIDKRYDLADVLADKTPIRLFRTLIEAREVIDNLSDITVSREHELFLAEIKREKEKIEQENTLLKIQQLKEKVIYEEKDSIRENHLLQQRQLHENQLAEYKAKLARQVAKHKEFTETLKTVGLGITFALTLYKVIF
jgi:hypothetical protein